MSRSAMRRGRARISALFVVVAVKLFELDRGMVSDGVAYVFMLSSPYTVDSTHSATRN
jgi:hypothetical protein